MFQPQSYKNSSTKRPIKWFNDKISDNHDKKDTVDELMLDLLADMT